MSKQFYACIYGGASEKIDRKYKDPVEHLGKLLATMGFSLVYGAGATGCMGASARGIHEGGGHVMGITPYFIGTFEEIYPCDHLVKVETMGERKTLMEKWADIFFIAPGGIGTMDEFFQVLTLRYLKRMDKPIYILNIDGFYDSLLAFMDDLVKKGAVGEGIYDLYEVVDSVEDTKIFEELEKIKE